MINPYELAVLQAGSPPALEGDTLTALDAAIESSWDECDVAEELAEVVQHQLIFGTKERTANGKLMTSVEGVTPTHIHLRKHDILVRIQERLKAEFPPPKPVELEPAEVPSHEPEE